MAAGKMTGVELPEQTGRGRPRSFVNDDARKLFYRLRDVERLVTKLAEEVGFTPAAASRLRGDLFAAGNGLNRNVHPAAVAKRRTDAKKAAAARAAKRRKNPADITHAYLMHGPKGERLTVCGFRACGRSVGGVWLCEVHITECPDLVTCPDCIDAGGPVVP